MPGERVKMAYRSEGQRDEAEGNPFPEAEGLPEPNRRPTCYSLIVAGLLSSCMLWACGTATRVTVRLIDGRPQASRYVSPKAYEHYLRAEIALQRGDRQESIRQLRLAVAFDPGSAFLHSQLGQVLALLGQEKAALAHVDEALRLRRGFEDALLLKARLQRNAEAAADALRQCIASNPNRPTAYVRLAELLQRESKVRTARELLEKMVQRLPGHRVGWASLGMLCLRAVDYRCAKKAFDHELRLQPRVETLARQAHVLQALGHTEQQERVLREAFDRSGGNARLAIELAGLLARTGQPRAVDDLLEVMERAAAGRPDRLASAAMAGIRGGRPSQVIVMLDRHLKKNMPPALLLAKAAALAELKHFDKAAGILSQITGKSRVSAMIRLAELSRQRPDAKVLGSAILKDALNQLGHRDELVVALTDALYHEGKAAQAVNVVRKAFVRHGGDKLHFALAAALEREGRHREAIAEMQRIRRRRPNDPSVYNFIGYLQADQRIDLAAAERSVRRALILGPGQPHIIDSLGWVAYRQGRLGEALRLLTLASRLSPEEPEVLAHRAAVLAALQRQSAALRLYRQALASCTDRQLAAKLRATIDRLAGGRIGSRDHDKGPR